ncbi:hypothetical protein PB2503_08624 [Parvularcula bermudensis HTCC2503]|uniref:General secretion pathway protein M n=1 Tax=Parvularcula bermudensis (strain ATCC BAA-594 / HTCC2503 / KCTC 12087) TaxID=314260 RepID=E0TBQ9_PARBH|nr:type II secretion system protein GspM [Parvularcula bermudensis]ADM09780.1 hypothetical protein PB2503_08624 [Parvularcula bermudensis HTCC2503]
MTEFWYARSVREQRIILAGAGALLLLIFVLLVVQPLIDYRRTAIADHQRAMDTYLAVTRAVSRASAGPVREPSVLRSTIDRVARERQIVLTRTAIDEDAVVVSTGGVTTATLMNWLDTLRDEHHIAVRDAQIRPASAGNGVTARLTLGATP